MTRMKYKKISADTMAFVRKLNSLPYYYSPLGELIINREVVEKMSRMSNYWKEVPEQIRLRVIKK